jgi:hypothetical protein
MAIISLILYFGNKQWKRTVTKLYKYTFIELTFFFLIAASLEIYSKVFKVLVCVLIQLLYEETLSARDLWIILMYKKKKKKNIHIIFF